MRPLIHPFLISIALLAAGCMSPVTDFVLPPDSPHQAPHPVTYQAPAEFIYLQGAETFIQSVSWSDQKGHWSLSGDLTITAEDGIVYETSQADVQGRGLSGSAGTLLTQARVTLEGPEATLGIGLFGGTMTLQHEVSLIGQVSSGSFTGQGTITGDTVTIEYSDESKITFTDSASVNMGRGIGVIGADVFAATFHAEDLRIRSERVVGEVTLHISHANNFRANSAGQLEMDVDTIQLYLAGEPKLGCQIHILQSPGRIEIAKEEGQSDTIVFRVEGPGSTVGWRSVAGTDDIYRLNTGNTRPIGTDPRPIQGPHIDGLIIFPGQTYESIITVRGDQDFQGTSISTLELRSLNCPTKKITVEVKAV